MLDRHGLIVPLGWSKGEGDWAGVNAAIARRARIQVIQEAGSTQWQRLLPPDHSFQFGFSDSATNESDIKFAARIWISPIQRRFALESSFPKVQWHPRVLWIGIGCQRGASVAAIERAVQEVLRSHHLAIRAIAGVATINSKADEAGLVEFCRDRALPLRYFAADVLRSVVVQNPSVAVESEVGTASVAEAAAVLGSSEWGVGSGESLVPGALRVPKRIVRMDEQPAVTIAIAEAKREYTEQLKGTVIETSAGDV